MKKNKETLKKEAVERKAEHDKLSIQQKIQKLDLRFGGGIGAVKERQKLAEKLQKLNSSPKQTETQEVKESGNVRDRKKPYQKPKKS